MPGYRTIVGPTAMRVERNGVTSATIPLDESDTPEAVRMKAVKLWESIRPFVSWAAWWSHRLRMAEQRRLTAIVQSEWPGPYFAGPRPDLIAIKPWRDVSMGDWTILPPGVVGRLIRSTHR